MADQQEAPESSDQPEVPDEHLEDATGGVEVASGRGTGSLPNYYPIVGGTDFGLGAALDS